MLSDPRKSRRTPHHRKPPDTSSHSPFGKQALLAILGPVLALLTLAGCQSAGARSGSCAPGDPKRVGHYYLNGVMEVGSELLLKPDGSFEFMLAYGALDQYGKGCWRVDGNRLLVIPAGRSAPAAQYSMDSARFVGFTLTIDGNALVWDLGDGHRGRYERG
jgi:hypothetical protein